MNVRVTEKQITKEKRTDFIKALKIQLTSNIARTV